METKYYLLNKEGKRVDDVLRTKDELRAKVNEIMQKENCDWNAIDANYNYEEVTDGGVSSEENTAKATNANANTSADSEFKATEANDDQYDFGSANDVYTPSVSDDEEGWNGILDNLKNLPSDIAAKVQDKKQYLTLSGNEGQWPIKKNALRVLYMYNNFLMFYDECNETLPPAVSSFLKKGQAWFNITRTEWCFDVVKKDMKDIVDNMLDALKDYFEGNDANNDREEFYDEVKDFDEEIENIHRRIMLFEKALKGGSVLTTPDKLSDDDKMRFVNQMAEDKNFVAFCNSKFNGQKTPAALSAYLMNIAVNKYHLGRIKLNSNDPNSTMSWMNPEENESKNVRLSENIEDYLDLRYVKTLDEADKKKVEEIKKEFLSGKKTQDEAKVAINTIVTESRNAIKKSLKLFFELMGITEAQKMNQFTSGLRALDDENYKKNWLRLVENYKETIKHHIEMYKKAHSNDITAEDLNACANKLETLIATADAMLEDVKKGDGTKLLSDVQSICTVIGDVRKKTAEAQKAFKGA